MPGSVNNDNNCYIPNPPTVHISDVEAIVRFPEDYPGKGTLVLWIESDEENGAHSPPLNEDIVIEDLSPDTEYRVFWTYDGEDENGNDCSTQSGIRSIHTLKKPEPGVLYGLSAFETECPPGAPTEWVSDCEGEECPPEPITPFAAACSSDNPCPPSDNETRFFTLDQPSGSGECMVLEPDAVVITEPTPWGFTLTMPPLPDDANFLVLEIATNIVGVWTEYQTPPEGLMGGQVIVTSDLDPGVTYFFRAKGVAQGGYVAGPISSEDTLYCPADFDYTINLAVGATVDEDVYDNQITVEYEATLNYPDSAILSLERTAQDPSVVLNPLWVELVSPAVWGSPATYIDTNLSPNVRFWYRLKATVNTGSRTGDLTYSEPASAITYSEPPGRPGAVVFDDTYGTSIKLIAPSELPVNATHFLVGYRLHGDDDFTVYIDPLTSEAVELLASDSVTISGLTLDTIYDFVFIAANNSPWQVYGDIASNKTDSADPISLISVPDKPEAPTITSVDFDNIVVLSPEWVINPDAPTTSMELQREGIGTLVTWIESSQEYTDENLVPLSIYRYRVRAINSEGESEWSDWTEVSIESEKLCVTWVSPPTERGACPEFDSNSSSSSSSSMSSSSSGSGVVWDSTVTGNAAKPCFVTPSSSSSSSSQSSASSSSISSSSSSSSVSSVSSSSSSMIVQDPEDAKQVYGRIALYFRVTRGTPEEVWIEANGLRLPAPVEVSDGLWKLDWDTASYINGETILKAFAVDEDGFWAFDITRVIVENTPAKLVFYQDTLPYVNPKTGFEYTDVHVGIDVFPLSPYINQRFWLEVMLRTTNMTNEFVNLNDPTKIKAALTAIAAQDKLHQMVAMKRGAPGTDSEGHPYSKQYFGITSLDDPGSEVTARFRFTPHEIPLVYQTGSEQISKIRKIEDGKFEIFTRFPSKLFVYDGVTLDLVADLSDEQYGTGLANPGDAVDAALIDDKIHVVRNVRLGSAVDELFIIDLTGGEVDEGRLPRGETRKPTFVERVGEDAIWILTDPDYPSYEEEGETIYERTVAYKRTATDTSKVWTLPEVIERVYVDIDTAGTSIPVQETGSTDTTDLNTQVMTYSVDTTIYNALGFNEPGIVGTFTSPITALNTAQVGLEDGRIFKYSGDAWFYDSTLSTSVSALSAWTGAATIKRSVAGNESAVLYSQADDLSWYPDRVLSQPPHLTLIPSSSSSGSSDSSSSSDSSASSEAAEVTFDISSITVLERFEKVITAASGQTLDATPAVIDERLMIGTGEDGLLFVIQRSKLSESTGAVAVSNIAAINVWPFAERRITSSSSRSSRSRSSRSSSSSASLVVSPSLSSSSSSISSASSTSSISSVSSSSEESSSIMSSSSSSSSVSSSSSSSGQPFQTIAGGATQTLSYETGAGSFINGWEIYWGRPGRPPYDEMISSSGFAAGWTVVVDTDEDTITITPPVGTTPSNNYIAYVEEENNMIGEVLFGVS